MTTEMTTEGTTTEDAGTALTDGVEQPAAVDAAPAQVAAPSVNIPENWKDALEAEFRDDPSMQTIQDVPSLVKSYLHTKKAFGADKVVLPSKHATPQEWKEFFVKGGLPEKFEDYKIESPELLDMEDGVFTELKTLAHEHGIFPHQLQEVLKWYSDASTKAQGTMQDTMQTQQKENITELKREWGQAYDAKLRDAKRVIKNFGGPEVNTWLEESGLGNQPDFIKLLANIGAKALGEDDILTGGEDTTAMAPTQASEELNKIMNNYEHPYYQNEHPNHGKAVEEVQRLMEMQHGTKAVPGMPAF